MKKTHIKKPTNYLLITALTLNIVCLIAIGVLSYKVYQNKQTDIICWKYQLQLDEILLTPTDKDKLSI